MELKQQQPAMDVDIRLMGFPDNWKEHLLS